MKDLKFYQYIEAEQEEIYRALTNPFTIELWSDSLAVMEEKEGSEFSLWDGDITGKNLKFVENKEIVQEWYFEDNPKESIVTIKLHEHKNGTNVELRHTNIPDEAFENINEGWREFYIGAIKRFFEEELY